MAFDSKKQTIDNKLVLLLSYTDLANSVMGAVIFTVCVVGNAFPSGR